MVIREGLNRIRARLMWLDEYISITNMVNLIDGGCILGGLWKIDAKRYTAVNWECYTSTSAARHIAGNIIRAEECEGPQREVFQG